MKQSIKSNTVFLISAVLVISIALWGFLTPEHMNRTMDDLYQLINNSFGWIYVLSTATMIGFCLYLGFGPYRHMKLGKSTDKPEYSYYSWIGMLFAAGMGVGLVFWGVGEPLSHYENPPNAESHSSEAGERGIVYGVFHWGIHPWAVYAIVALGLAFAKFRKNLPGLISSSYFSLLGRKINGPIGYSIDIIAIIGTTVGIATSFGLSTIQLGSGLEQLMGTDNTITLQLFIIIIITCIFIFSVVTGINKGMRYLSNINLFIALFLMISVITLGPTLFIMEHIPKTVGNYLSEFVSLSFQTTPYSDNEWIGDWTFFYWAWVISWSPFVGTFIARISKGRTLQEFILGVLFVPALVTIIWFTAFGGSAVYNEIEGHTSISETVYKEPETGLFLLLNELPFGVILSALALLLISIFFITSANSATYVLGVFSSKGNLEPRNNVLVIWGLLISSIAGAILISGGIDGLQALAITTALPFTLLILLMMVSMLKSLKREGKKLHKVSEKEDW
ncbi:MULTISPECIES: BCCT family transporter [Bacillaceae]|uniref:BCCT family transporter n=1 Tax=Evansella alkalicola TaxID=745819 RepID=A0ABS6JRX6_9BACI|nr:MULTISPECIES: BCCT family transporter [Bacillaceae]MBU9721180.1 BCCT family transporter [Bacillus alkalicola]